MNHKPDAVLPVTDPHKTPTVFVNQVAGCGHLNGVVNVTFATAQFTPNKEGKIDPDLVITSRLRMDMACARQLHEQIGRILDQQNIAPSNGTTH